MPGLHKHQAILRANFVFSVTAASIHLDILDDLGRNITPRNEFGRFDTGT